MNLPIHHHQQDLTARFSPLETKPFEGRYLTILSLYFAGLTVSMPVQFFLLQDLNLSDSIDVFEFLQSLPFLNWVCMISYSTTAVALMRRSTKIWAHLTATVLLTGINNSFVAFTGWDYSALQVFSGSLLFCIPIAPTVLSAQYRQRIWQKRKFAGVQPAPRFDKRWRVEILTEGRVVPSTGITLNISESGALVHLLNEDPKAQDFGLRLSEAKSGLILECQAKRVREALRPALSNSSPLPVVGVQFMGLDEEQKRTLKNKLQ